MAAKPQRVIIAGHSHADTLFGNCLRASVEPKLFQLDEGREIYGLVGAFPRKPDYWRALEREARDSAVVLFWGGNDHNGLFMFESAPRFDLVREDLEWFDPTAQLVPTAAVQKLFYNIPHVQECLPVLRMLREVPGCRLLLSETPPPKGDDVALRQFITVEFAALAEARGISIDNAPLTHPQTRLKLWRTMRDAYAQMAAEAGVEFRPLPEWVFDDAGFLKREYWLNDATHANAAYADRLRAELLEQLL